MGRFGDGLQTDKVQLRVIRGWLPESACVGLLSRLRAAIDHHSIDERCHIRGASRD